MAVILFDIDGTLIDGGGAGRQAMDRTAHQLYGASGFPAIPLAGRTDHAIFGDLLRHLGLSGPGHYPVFRRHYLVRLAEELIDPVRPPVLLPGVRRLLEELKRIPGCRLGLVTGNCREAAFLKLKHAGIDHFFEGGGFGDWTSCRTEVARHAVAGFFPEEKTGRRRVAIIGDTPHDIACARGAEAVAVGVASGSSSLDELQLQAPDILYGSFQALTARGLLDRLSDLVPSDGPIAD